MIHKIVAWLYPPSVKSLGPVDHPRGSARYAERKHEADAMPFLVLTPRPVVFHTAKWLTGGRELPKVPRSRLR